MSLLLEWDEIPDLERVRIAMRAETERTSLRSFARRLGVSATGLSGFLDGNESLYAKTRRKYLVWFLEHAGDGDEVLRVAIAIVLRSVKPADRQEVADWLHH